MQNAVAIQDDSREFRPGEHVVAFWFESKFQWYLGVVDDVDQEGVPTISYMIRAGENNSDWVFPETAEVLRTSTEQIMGRKIPVTYQCTVRIRCKITSRELVSDLDAQVEELNYNQHN